MSGQYGVQEPRETVVEFVPARSVAQDRGGALGDVLVCVRGVTSSLAPVRRLPLENLVDRPVYD